jgi:TonB family protein
MIEVLLYIIKSILAGAIFFGFYHLFMRRESYLNLSRFYLLISAVLMVILPLIGIFIPDVFAPGRQSVLPVITLPEVVVTASRIVTPEEERVLMSWAGLGYLAVTMALLAGFMVSIFRIIRFYRSTTHAEKLEDNVYLVSGTGSPFSFLGRVFISNQYIQHPDLKSILVHENTHIKQKHLLDLIFLELLSSIFWFNPFFFLIKRAMREVHEYLADREVIRHGTEPVAYQQLLFNEVSGNAQYVIANNFNLLTKKRIIMLIRKSGKKAALRIGILMPFLMAATIVIALLHSYPGQAQNLPVVQKSQKTETTKPSTVGTPEKTTSAQTSEKKTDKCGKEVYTKVDEEPQFPGGNGALAQYIVKTVQYPAEARKKGIQGTVYVSFIVEKDGLITNVKADRGIGGGCDEEAVRVVSGMPKWISGKINGQVVRVKFMLPIVFTLS